MKQKLEILVDNICSFSPRQGEGEKRTAEFIENYFNNQKMSFQIQHFETTVPIITHNELFLDGELIPCLGACFESGKITSKSQIDYNPNTDYIETTSYTPQASVRISRINKHKLEEAKQISGDVRLDKYSFTSRNILVGNSYNPRNILLAHYDGLGGGAIDNAGSVAVLIDIILKERGLLEKNLFVLCGNEELSYDKEVFWGRGYRQFEKEYSSIMKNARQIIVVDGVGLTETKIIKEDIDEFFPVNDLREYENNLYVLSSVQSEVLKCYHCFEDTPDKLSESNLVEARQKIMTLLQQKDR